MNDRVLFVGEDTAMWDEMNRHFATSKNGLNMSFARSGPEALSQLEQLPFRAVVADMQIKGMNGAQLLGEVLHRHPSTLRFIRADLADHQSVMKCVGTAHQYIVKPCDAETVISILTRAFQLDTWLPSDAAHRVISQLRRLPSPPQVYFKVVEALQSPEANLENIGTLIEQDPAMTAKLLQLVNSAVFGLQLQVSNPIEAVLYLGMDTTKSVILLAHTFSYFDRINSKSLSVSGLWEHSIRVGKVAQSISRAEGKSEDMCSEAFTAGMLHDAGKLALVANMPEEFMRAVDLARERKIELWEAEREVFGANHAEIGGCLLGIWGLPVPIVEAVALHHHPSQLVSKGFSALSAVHAANVVCHRTQTPIKGVASPQFDEPYFTELGLVARYPEWEKVSAGGQFEN
jgi:HD-like signal output (HDOD) protein/CheY-like chemotaxis protein